MRFARTLAALSVLVVPIAAVASPITIFGTGIGAVGSVDTHYTLASAPAGASSASAKVSTVNPAWFHPAGSLHWINPSGSGVQNEPIGFYDYRTTFNIGPGFAASTAKLRLIVAADDQVSIFLNGNLVALSGIPDFLFTTVYNVNSGFVQGTNTLDFEDFNIGGPEGLYVEASGTVSPVPEPSSVALLGTGLLSAAAFARRRLLRS